VLLATIHYLEMDIVPYALQVQNAQQLIQLLLLALEQILNITHCKVQHLVLNAQPVQSALQLT